MGDWLLGNVFPLRKKDRIISWLLGLGALALYLLLPVRSASYDSLAYAIETISDIARRHFHPHHLLFSRTNWLFISLIRLFVQDISPLITMVWFNCILSTLTLVFFYRSAFLVSGKRLVSLLITVILALSWTYYFFSSSGDTVIPANFLLIVAIYLALNNRSQTIGRLIVVATVTGLAMLYHQMSIFYIPIIMVLALRKYPARKLINRSLIFLAFSLGLAVATYLAVMVFYYGLNCFGTMWFFLTQDVHISEVWGTGNPWAYIKGLGYLLNSGNCAFSIDVMNEDEVLWSVLGSALSWVLLVVVVVVVVVRAVRKEWLGVVIGGTIGATMTFINWWEAPTTDYWVFPWMLLLLLVAWVSRSLLSMLLSIGLLFYIPAVFTLNWSFKLARFTDPATDLKGRAMVILAKRVEPAKTILLSDDSNLLLRAQLNKLYSISFPVNEKNWQEGTAEFAYLFLQHNPGVSYVLTDSIHSSYMVRIRPYLPSERIAEFDVAFANAIPLVETSDRWGGELVLWLLGSSSGEAAN